MSILTPILAVILGALGIWANRYLKGPIIFQHIIVGVVVLVVVVWLLAVFGLLGDLRISAPIVDAD